MLARKDPHFLLHLHIVPQKGSSQRSPSLIPGTSILWDPYPLGPPSPETPSPGTSIPWHPANATASDFSSPSMKHHPLDLFLSPFY